VRRMPAADIGTRSFDDLLTRHLAREAAESQELAAACEQVLRNGGKRLRPRMLEAAAAAGPEPSAPAVALAAVAVEMLHCASLAHDDVIDDASLRRGRETVSERRGAIAAALTGGWLFGRSAAIVAGGSAAAAAPRFAAAAARVCEGQMLEVCDLFDPDRSAQRYFQAIGGKTATLFELSAALGAELAGASAPAVETAAECGWSFGIAFQILDDVNDLLADAAATGKQAGKDLLQGVHTLPVIYAAEERPELRDALALGVSPDSLPSVLGSIRATAGPARALDHATAHADRARSEAYGLPGGESLEALIEEALIAPLSSL
jgi:geranylgeranyl pyrophosphate synthase